MRFVARALSGSGSLNVSVRYQDNSNVIHILSLGTLDAGSYLAWTPTPIFNFLNGVASLSSQTNGIVWLTLAPSGAAKWQVDDLYIDPYKAR
jgi:hypothetical protein